MLVGVSAEFLQAVRLASYGLQLAPGMRSDAAKRVTSCTNVQATLGIKEKVIAQIQAVVANTPNPSLDPDCLARCGFSTSSAGK